MPDRRRRPRTIGVAAPSELPTATATAALADVAATPAKRWIRDYRNLALASDIVVVLLANLLGLWLRYGIFRSPFEFASEGSLAFRIAGFAIAAGWIAALAASGAYEGRFLGTGSDEFKRVVNASVRLAAVTGMICYLSWTNLARGYVATTLVLGTLGLLASRYILRKHVHRLRRSGRWSHRVLAVGSRGAVAELIAQTRAEPYAGLTVIGACL